MLIFGIIYLSVAFLTTYADDVTVETKVGTFVGFSDDIDIDGDNFQLSKFFGIPYAEPPVGDLRFRKPVPKGPMSSEPMMAKELESTCMQVMMMPNPTKGSEDCLYLNIISPKITPGLEKLPVMIWIHGGGFIMGSANTYIPDRLVANGPVIVVTINYRLSVWGFLSTSDSNAPGNYGLWDQHVAIEWVHDNIDAFGGDPEKVTVFGESAGSISAIHQGLYKGNKGLFQRIIGQSGTTVMIGENSRGALSDAKYFATLAGCEASSTEDMMACLRNLPSDVINGTMNDFTNGLVAFPLIFLPHVDHDFIEETPAAVFNLDKQVADLSRSTFTEMDLLSGVVSGEGYFMSPPSPMDVEGQNNFYPNRTFFQETLVPQLVYGFLGEAPPAIVEAVAAEYTDWNDPENPETIRQQVVSLIGDALFIEPMFRTVDVHARLAQRQTSYMYYFTLMPSKHGIPTAYWADRPNHGDDMIYVFGGEGDLSEFGINEKFVLEDWEKEVSLKVMTMWTNFAKTGNPNRPRDIGLDWLPYTNKHRHYLDISRTMTSYNVKKRLEERRVNFWSKIIPTLKNALKKEGTCSKENDCEP